MPAQAGARYIKRERVATLESVEAGWVKLWRQVHPLPVESKAELQSLIESYLQRNKPRPAAPPSAVVTGHSNGTSTVSLGEAVQPALLRRVERYFETGRGKTCEIDRVAWRRFVSWCEDTGHTPLPCTSEALLRYLSALERRGLSRGTMAQAVSAVGKVYRIAGLPSPVSPEARAMVNPALEQRSSTSEKSGGAMGTERKEGREGI
jgi:hypothetical protein